MTYVLGIDGGTESLRVHVFDFEGRSIASSSYSYETRFSAGGRAEQNPEDWWNAIGVATRQAIAESGIAPEAIEGLTLATTCCSVVALDQDGRPLRPAIIWMDLRADEEAAAVLATGDGALRINSAGQGPISPEWMIPKALWIARNEPKIYDSAHTICEYQDFMTMRLTGRRACSLNNAAVRWHYSTKRPNGFPISLLRALDLEDLQRKWPSEVLPPGAVIGSLTAAAAKHLGLPPSTKVMQGGADAYIGMIGLGVAKPGQLSLITGSSHLQFAVVAKDVSATGIWGAYPDALYPGRYLIEGGQTSTGSIINWLRRLTGDKFDFEALNREAAALPPGCDGLTVLDHFQGNRTPYTDPLSRGAIVGLTLAHDLPHLFRAVIEGICFGTRTILDTMADAGYAASEIVIGGGATRSDLWLQIHADTARLPIVVPETAEAPALGAAILAYVGLGRFPSIDDGIAAMVKPGRRIMPRERESALYDQIYKRYAALYPAFKEMRASQNF